MEKNVIVLTSRSIDIPEDLRSSVSSSSEAPAELCERLSKKGFKHLYIDGGITIQSFLKAGLIHEMTITLVPVILGEGKSLFCFMGKDIALTHLGTTSYEFGFVQIRYRLNQGA